MKIHVQPRMDSHHDPGCSSVNGLSPGASAETLCCWFRPSGGNSSSPSLMCLRRKSTRYTTQWKTAAMGRWASDHLMVWVKQKPVIKNIWCVRHTYCGVVDRVPCAVFCLRRSNDRLRQLPLPLTCSSHDCHQVADYIPQLAKFNPELWGVSLCTVDGQR